MTTRGRRSAATAAAREGSPARLATGGGRLPAMRDRRCPRVAGAPGTLPIPDGRRALAAGGPSRANGVGSERELRIDRPVVGAAGVVEGPSPYGDEVVREEEVIDPDERNGGNRTER